MPGAAEDGSKILTILVILGIVLGLAYWFFRDEIHNFLDNMLTDLGGQIDNLFDDGNFNQDPPTMG